MHIGTRYPHGLERYLSKEATKFWKRNFGPLPATHQIVARDRDASIKGFIRYSAFSINLGESKEDAILAQGTWVDRACRKKNVARRMWSLLIKTHKPKRVLVTISTPAGKAFMRKLKQRYPRVWWHIEDNGV
jgi:hypothetical protein